MFDVRLIAGVVLIMLLTAQVFGQDTDADHCIEASKAHLANLEALRKGDCVGWIKRVSTGNPSRSSERDPNEKVHYETITYFRFAFDLDSNQYLYLSEFSVEAHVYDAQGQEIFEKPFPTVLQRNARLVSDLETGKILARDLGRNFTFEKEHSDLPNLARSLQIPNIWGLGISSASNTNPGVVADGVKSAMNTDAIGSVNEVRNGVFRSRSSTSKIRSTDGSDVARVLELDWDFRNHTPVRTATVIEVGKPVTKTTQTMAEEVTWKTIDGYNVPVKLTGHSRGSVAALMTKFSVDAETKMQLHWISVGKPISEELLREENITDDDKANELLCKSLLEVEE